MKIVVIGDGDTATGFRLAGADAFEVSGREDGETILRYALSAKDVGLIIITEEVARGLAELITEARRRALPMVVVIPASIGPVKIPSLGEQVKRLFGLGYRSQSTDPNRERGRE